MANKRKIDVEDTRVRNAAILADLVVDPVTSSHLQVQIIKKLLEGKESPDFFPTIFEEKLSYGACPTCSFETHWLIPEDILNKYNWISFKKDSRIKENTTIDDCEKYQEACLKKKIDI